ncbi:MAG: hypothetical protein L6R41_006346 [Letrouitia leprolyta]|nr:MAG: hypothetical protein L6R41_006346 [Letrouitia leprolyta]
MSSEDERFFQQGFQAAMGDEDNDDEETVETGVGTKSKGKQPEKSVETKRKAVSEEADVTPKKGKFEPGYKDARAIGKTRTKLNTDMYTLYDPAVHDTEYLDAIVTQKLSRSIN